jgi:hypothetical protein
MVEHVRKRAGGGGFLPGSLPGSETSLETFLTHKNSMFCLILLQPPNDGYDS